MRYDGKSARTLARLASLQELQVAREMQTLADAALARKAAEQAEHDARESLHEEEADLARLFASGAFAPDAFRRKGQIMARQAELLVAAGERSGTAREQERDSTQRWQQSRYQHDWLIAAHRSAARKVRQKKDDKAIMEVSALLLARQRNLP